MSCLLPIILDALRFDKETPVWYHIYLFRGVFLYMQKMSDTTEI